MNAKPQIKQRIHQAKAGLAAGDDPVDVTRGLFAGKTALAISAGPSMKEWRRLYTQIGGEDVVVACVKQTIESVGALCDIHFLNPYNHQKYSGDHDDRLVVFTDLPGAPRVFGYTDIRCRVEKQAGDRITETLAATRNFGSWDYEATGLARPWGPGIMHEAVLYTLLHMGVSRVVTAGWDIADDSGGNSHFYDAPSPRTERTRVGKRRFTNAMRKLALWRTPWFFVLHALGKRYNPPSLLQDEAEVISASLADFLAWFDQQGMRVDVVSDSSWVLDNCPEYSRPIAAIETLKSVPSMRALNLKRS